MRYTCKGLSWHILTTLCNLTTIIIKTQLATLMWLLCKMMVFLLVMKLPRSVTSKSRLKNHQNSEKFSTMWPSTRKTYGSQSWQTTWVWTMLGDLSRSRFHLTSCKTRWTYPWQTKWLPWSSSVVDFQLPICSSLRGRVSSWCLSRKLKT